MRESTRWRGCCWKHPGERVVGVCASCLRERLLALATSEDRYHPRRSLKTSSLNSISSGSNAHAADANTVANLMEKEHRAQCKFRSSEKERSEAVAFQSSAPPLRRSVSWSQSKASRNSLANMTPDIKWENYRMPSPLSAVFPQNSIHPSTSAIKPDSKTEPKSSSWFSSLLHWRVGRRKFLPDKAAGAASSSSKQNKKQRWFRRKAAFTSKDDIFAKNVKNAWPGGGDLRGESAMSWMSGPLPQTEDLSYGEKDSFGAYLRNTGNNRYESQPTRRVIRLSSTGRSEQGATENLDDFKHSEKDFTLNHQIDHRQTSRKPWTTPLRIFNRKSRKGKEDMAANSWKLSSDYDHRHSPAHPASYSAFYRDHGSLSLYSSPMPAGKYKGRRPFDGRSEMFQSSPYMGSSSWNFYLTPVRPIKSSSKQRP